ncbi:hypothetical protein [Klebsiella variicola]|uniref:hypothetical protein n=1 Tax=Klebsiella variicola TaxID=244366 RepID=UPI002929364F|nr:hypothetical protein [Klebsiella variicola]MDV0346403.1 hypothetical protein [Klebsiella variicola]MDV0415729.1 hypothetical protein [Klebsiella variicola]
MKNEIEQIAQQNDMSIEFVTWFFNEKKAGCGNVWFMMMAAMWEGWKGRSIEMDKLAAENVALKQFPEQIVQFIGGLGTSEIGSDTKEKIGLAASRIKTPTTDRIVAEAEARGVEKAIAHLEKKFSNIGVQIMNLQWLADSLRKGASE